MRRKIDPEEEHDLQQRLKENITQQKREISSTLDNAKSEDTNLFWRDQFLATVEVSPETLELLDQTSALIRARKIAWLTIISADYH